MRITNYLDVPIKITYQNCISFGFTFNMMIIRKIVKKIENLWLAIIRGMGGIYNPTYFDKYELKWRESKNCFRITVILVSVKSPSLI
jgi:hypothetical protein